MAIWIKGQGWADGKDRYLFTAWEFSNAYWFAFAMGACSFAPMAFFFGRASAIHHWF